MPPSPPPPPPPSPGWSSTRPTTRCRCRRPRPTSRGQPIPVLARGQLLDRPRAGHLPGPGTLPDDPDRQRLVLAEATARPEVVGVFSDPVISTCLVCPGDPAVGNDQDVADQLGVKALADAGLDGYRVPVVIVDTGINLAHLESKGRDPKFSRQRSRAPAGVATRAGQHPVGHGTMCAYDVGIAAPKATLVDHALLLSETPARRPCPGCCRTPCCRTRGCSPWSRRCRRAAGRWWSTTAGGCSPPPGTSRSATRGTTPTTRPTRST